MRYRSHLIHQIIHERLSTNGKFPSSVEVMATFAYDHVDSVQGTSDASIGLFLVQLSL